MRPHPRFGRRKNGFGLKPGTSETPENKVTTDISRTIDAVECGDWCDRGRQTVLIRSREDLVPVALCQLPNQCQSVANPGKTVQPQQCLEEPGRNLKVLGLCGQDLLGVCHDGVPVVRTKVCVRLVLVGLAPFPFLGARPGLGVLQRKVR